MPNCQMCQGSGVIDANTKQTYQTVLAGLKKDNYEDDKCPLCKGKGTISLKLFLVLKTLIRGGKMTMQAQMKKDKEKKTE